MRLGVLLSGGGRTMLNLQEAIDAGELDAEIVTVVASRPCKGLGRAAEAGLATHLVNYRDFGADRLAEYSDAITACLDRAGVELVIMAGFLSKWIIPAGYAGRVMNIHPALLPKFGGQGMFGHHVHEAVIAAGEVTSGCTVHFVNNDYDSGPIILQRSVPVEPGDTPEDLAARVFVEECIAYPEAIRRYAAGELS